MLSSNMEAIIYDNFRKQEKRIKIEQNRRLRQIQEQVPGCQQHIKKDVILS